MCVRVCMCVYVCVCECVCECVRVCVRVYIYIYVYVYMCVCVHVYVYMCACLEFRDRTLKTLYEQTYAALLRDTEGEKKFEASDVKVINGHFYVVCDNSWAVGHFDPNLSPFSADNYMIGQPTSAKGDDSSWEALVYDEQKETVWVTREAMQHSNTKHYHGVVQELKLSPNQHDYEILRDCPSEFRFMGENKGFEGMVGLRSHEGDELLMLGLCEGNYCDTGKRGQEAGNGRLVLMRLTHVDGGCMWKTIRVINIPSEAKFTDYSAIAIRKNRVAITSQESSQLFLGQLNLEAHNDYRLPKDLHSLKFVKGEGRLLDFPRDNQCHVTYCNIEGIDFVNDNVLVAVSDKMKGNGRQDFRCLAKDQSVHVFGIP
eukprot:GHVU01227372.1.p1 GENE.GHVU01227372.1~~GHVU01227372.1.p1  ORF type:complete len:372 (+),score=72.41 GHVU01227372.1:2-1117(+)